MVGTRIALRPPYGLTAVIFHFAAEALVSAASGESLSNVHHRPCLSPSDLRELAEQSNAWPFEEAKRSSRG